MDEAKADIFFLIRLGENCLDFLLLVLDDEDEGDIIFGVGGVLLRWLGRLEWSKRGC